MANRRGRWDPGPAGSDHRRRADVHLPCVQAVVGCPSIAVVAGAWLSGDRTARHSAPAPRVLPGARGGELDRPALRCRAIDEAVVVVRADRRAVEQPAQRGRVRRGARRHLRRR